MNEIENWINEVVAQKADGHNHLIPGIVKDGFQQELQANITYHRELAKGLTNEVDHSLSKYHTLMADIYENMMCK